MSFIKNFWISLCRAMKKYAILDIQQKNNTGKYFHHAISIKPQYDKMLIIG
jgi:hypothetical protein